MKTNPAFAHAAAWRGDSSSDAELAGGSPVHSVDVGAETMSEYGPDDGSTMTEIDASGKTPPPPIALPELILNVKEGLVLLICPLTSSRTNKNRKPHETVRRIVLHDFEQVFSAK